MLSNDWATWTNKVVGKKCTYSCVRRCGTIQWSSLLSYRQLSLFRYVYWGKGRCVLQNIRASRILSIISCTFLKDHAEVSCANNLLFTVIRRFKFGWFERTFHVTVNTVSRCVVRFTAAYGFDYTLLQVDYKVDMSDGSAQISARHAALSSHDRQL